MSFADEERQPDDRYMIHVHTYYTETDVSDDHQHTMLGVSSPARPSSDGHIHRLRIRTSFLAEDDHGHWHWVDVLTGPSFTMPDGSHIHYFCGVTSYNDRHEHEFTGATGLAPAVEEIAEGKRIEPLPSSSPMPKPKPKAKHF